MSSRTGDRMAPSLALLLPIVERTHVRGTRMSETRPTRWSISAILAAPLELIALAWCVPLVILAVGAPIALGLKLLLYLAGLS
jgi:hypothetical protein